MPKYKSAKPIKPITLDDMKNYLSSDIELWVKALVVCLWTYGIRINEALSLRTSNIFQSEEYLWLDSTPSKNPDKQRRILPVPLSSPYLDTLISYVNTLGEMALVFPYTSDWARKKLKVLDSTLCPHRFRHNRATVTALQRPHPFELQAWMGHKSITSTMKYIHASGIFAEDLGRKIIIR